MRALMFLVFFSLSSTVNASARLDLQCIMSSSNYSEMDDVFETKEVSLNGRKNQVEGRYKVFDLPDYEVWVMTHTQQKINNEITFRNFQIALRDKRTDVFIHALSNTLDMLNENVLSGRVSLVEYVENSFMEKGELFFECKQKSS